MVRYRIPEELLLVTDAFKTMAIVNLNDVKKHLENRGFSYTKCQKDGPIIAKISETCWFPEYPNAIKIIKALMYEPERLLMPDKDGAALLPFGGKFAIAIAPSIEIG